MSHLKGAVFAVITLLLTFYFHPILHSSIMSIPTMKADSALNASSTTKALARKKFQGAWEVIRAELLEHMQAEGMPNDAKEWYKRVDINVYIYVCDLATNEPDRRTWITTSLVVSSTAECLLSTPSRFCEVEI
jgi:hypothetical protein